MSGLTLGRIRGIELRVGWSVLIIGTLIALSLAEEVLPTQAEGYDSGAYWLASIAVTIAFFASLLAHEMGHSVVAQRDGVEVRSITLWLLGGLAQLGSSPSTPRSEMRIAIAGPAVSAGLGAAALSASFGLSGLAGATFAWLGTINLALAVFNLLPAFPLDGGRLYRAWRWARLGDEVEATRRAAETGRVVGTVLIVLGVVEAVVLTVVGGLWLMLIGWFIREAARAEWHQMLVERPLSAIPVSQVMTRDPDEVHPATTLASFVEGLLLQDRHLAYPVTRTDGSLVGLLTLESVGQVPRTDWDRVSAGAAAVPVERVLIVPPSRPVTQVLAEMEASGRHRALVVEGDDLAGIVALTDITRLAAVFELLGRPGASSQLSA